MCTCASCKVTDAVREWPKAVSRRQITAADVRLRADPVYAAHWRHCGVAPKGPTLMGSPFPCTGTPQTDGRAGYAFPGGRAPLRRQNSNDKPRAWSRFPALPAEDDSAAYVRAFVAANHLT